MNEPTPLDLAAVLAAADDPETWYLLPAHCRALVAEVERLRAEAVRIDDENTAQIETMEQRFVAMRTERDTARATIASMAERIAAQSELLSRKAEGAV